MSARDVMPPKGSPLDDPAYSSLVANLTAAGYRILGPDEEDRETAFNVRSRLRMAFRKALSELPEVAPPEVASILSSVHMRDEFFNEGKRLQMLYGTGAVAPRVEQECGAGAWSFMRQGVATAIRSLSQGEDRT